MVQGAASEPGGAGRALEDAHRELMARGDLQFQFEAAKAREVRPTPNWLRDFFEWLGDLLSLPGDVLRVAFWILVAGAVLAILYLIARELGALDWRFRRAKAASGEAQYQPRTEVAIALLADADALAAEGLYEEAVHVLLLRSVEDMRRWRPQAVEPSLTSRDLSRHPVLPPPARQAFGAMALLVEKSLFAGRMVGREGYEESRRAYEAFALPGVWA